MIGVTAYKAVMSKFDLGNVVGLILLSSDKVVLSGTFSSHELRRMASTMDDVLKIEQENKNG